MSKKGFKKATSLARVQAVVSKVLNRGQKDEKVLYDIYKNVTN